MNKRKRTITFNAPAVLWFVILCFGAMILNVLTGGLTNRLLFSTYRASLLNPLTWLRLFTHVLGHVSWQHFIGNMTYILLLGPMLEEKYGWRRLVGVMAVTAGITGVVHTVLFPGAALCGASGIVFASAGFDAFAVRTVTLWVVPEAVPAGKVWLPVTGV